ncbi:protein slender lobes isoform X2 [Drosophila miranda]|nr:protein slender lobes isoform X2 [Drosophila miranda]
MEDIMEKKEGVRVTRARTRRLSALDTDSRPGTPLLDTASDRGTASPRPTRRTRLNSATEGPTPTRTTRASLVRGETPEPITPASVKRTARTPAKATRSVRKQLPVKEELEPEDEEQTRSKNSSFALAQSSPTDEKRVTRSMSQTPPAAYRSANNTPQPVLDEKLQSDPSLSVEEQPIGAKAVVDFENVSPTDNKNKHLSRGRSKLPARVENLSTPAVAAAEKDKDVSWVSETLTKSLESESTESVSEDMTQGTSGSPQKMEAQVESLADEMSKAETKQAAEEVKAKRRSTIDLLEEVDKDIETFEIPDEQQNSGWADKEQNAEVEIEADSKSITSDEVFESSASPDPEPENSTTLPMESPASPDPEPQNSSTSALKKLAMEDEPRDEMQPPDLEPRDEMQPPDLEPIENNNNSTFKDMAMEVDEDLEIPDKDKDLPHKSLDSSEVLEVMAEDEEEKPQWNRPSIGMKIIDNVQLPDLTPGIKTRLVASGSVDSKKSVAFDSDSEDADDEKVKFPKTPSRNKNPSSFLLEKSVMRAHKLLKTDTPLKTETPLKADTPLMKDNSLKTDTPSKIRTPLKMETPLKKDTPLKTDTPLMKDTPLKTVTRRKADTPSKTDTPLKKDTPLKTDTSLMKDTHLKMDTPLQSGTLRKMETPLKKYTPLKTETPLKVASIKARNSSTPLQSDDREASISLLKPAPARIDCLKPWAQVEAENREKDLKKAAKAKPQPTPPKKVSSGLRLNSDDEDEDDEEEFLCEFVENEAEEAPADYKSGDSMDCSEQREIEENEIVDEGESVGSQDTDGSYEDESISNDSFIVSDTSDVVELRYSSNELEAESLEEMSPKGKKHRARIIVMDSSDEEEQAENKQEEEKENGENQQRQEDEEEKHSERPTNQSNCSSNASKLSEAAQNLIGSQEHYSTSETELENSRKLFLNEINKSECLNKTASRLDMTIMDVDSESDNKDDPQTAATNKSIYEVLDSDEDVGEEQNDNDNDNDAENEDEDEDEEPSSSNKFSSIAHQKQKVNDEEALLAELASSDLTHLKTMFNPLQKSRRQSLYMPSPEMAAKEPKLQRRSERDFCPSQSFVEMMAERKVHQAKRKRLSKSFSGAAEELEVMEVRQEHKRAKNEHDESSGSMEEDMPPAESPDIPKEESPKKQEEQSEGLQQPKDQEMDEEMPSTEDPSKKEAEKTQTFEKWSKNTDHYLDVCASILQRANEAKLEQKKLQVAAGRKHNKPKPTVSEAVFKSVDSTDTDIREATKPLPLKKELKRLQAARNAVSHAVNLLAPQPVAIKEPRSLLRKLSPQPPMEAKKPAKGTKKQKKALLKTQLVSPVKSSDEENHNKSTVVNRIKTNAGYVTVTMDDAPEPLIELVKTRSGIMRVEPATPKQKYFREEPDSPPNRKFRVQRVPAGSHKKSKQQQQPPKEGGKVVTHNPAMLSALRFKEQVFARK